MDEERYDGLLLSIAQQQGGIEPLLHTFFSFLRRKTDFFVGASPAVVQDTVNRVVKREQEIALRDAERKRKEREQQQERAKKQREEAEERKRRGPRIEVLEEAGDKPADAAAAATDATAAADAPAAADATDAADATGAADAADAAAATDAAAAADASADASESTGGDAPVGNGGRTSKYVWTQTLAEASAFVFVPEGVRTRDLEVQITTTRLMVKLRGQPALVDGALFKRVKPDDCLWTLDTYEGRRCVALELQKENTMEWWKTIIQGDPEIDTTKVVPENSKLADLDGETRQTVEKMMFDQRQKAMGLPSSDELRKLEVLERFKKQHPEFDFSNAKIS